MNSIKLRSVNFEDYDKLAVLLSKGFPKFSPKIWKARFNVWWKTNPRMSPSIPKGWLLEKDKSDIVGFLGNIPVNYQINGKLITAAASSSWYVKPKFSVYFSLQLMRAYLSQESVDLFISTTPNEITKTIFTQFGFSAIDFPLTQAEYIKILNYKKLIPFIFQDSKKIMKSLSFQKIDLDNLRKTLTKKKKSINPEQKDDKFYCTICNKCDLSFTELWHKHKHKYPVSIYRDADTLNWLFFSDLVKNKRNVLKCLRRHDNRLMGYFVMDLVLYKKENMKILQLRDSFVPESDDRIITSLISETLNLAKKKNACLVKLWPSDKAMDKTFKKLFLFKRKITFTHLYKFKTNSKLTGNLFNNYNFFPSMIEPDRGLI